MAFMLFDLSPVIKIHPTKTSINKNKKKLYLILLLKKLSKKNPTIINIKPKRYAPTIGSSLKKLTILSLYFSLP